jgi:amino acid transporter
MIGAGVFINPSPLTKLAGQLGCLSYLGVALLILPLVISIAQLARLYPNTYGGLYIYSKNEIGFGSGIVSGLAYFIGKCFSCAVLSRTFAVYLAHIFPACSLAPLPLISIIMIFVLCFLNLFGIRTSSKVQVGFIIFKVLPIILVILSAYFAFSINSFSSLPINIDGFVSSLSVAMYGLLGFESCCAIGNTLLNPKKNLARAVLSSFAITVLIYSVFQTLLFGSVGMALQTTDVPLALFALKIQTYSASLASFLSPFLNSAILISVIGSCYGILFFNNWNGYAIIEELSRKALALKSCVKINSYGMPIYPIILQGILASIFVLMPIPTFILAKLAVLWVVVTYFMSCIALAAYQLRHKEIKSFYFFISMIGILSSGFIAYSCLKELIK